MPPLHTITLSLTPSPSPMHCDTPLIVTFPSHHITSLTLSHFPLTLCQIHVPSLSPPPHIKSPSHCHLPHLTPLTLCHSPSQSPSLTCPSYYITLPLTYHPSPHCHSPHVNTSHPLPHTVTFPISPCHSPLSHPPSLDWYLHFRTIHVIPNKSPHVLGLGWYYSPHPVDQLWHQLITASSQPLHGHSQMLSSVMNVQAEEMNI